MSKARTAIKICGVTRIEDARAAVLCRADFIGLIFVKESPRNVTLDTARSLAETVEGVAMKVGVFKDADPEFMSEVLSAVDLDFVQCHGKESPDYLSRISKPVIKAIEIEADSDVDALSKDYLQAAKYLLFDRPKTYTHPRWLAQMMTLLEESSIDRTKYFIAGGLTPDNVASAVGRLQPFAVDVASGIESAPGVKDYYKMEAFCNAVREAAQSSNGGDRQ